MHSKELYAKTIASLDSAPIFFQPWWLDAVCGEKWRAIVINHGNEPGLLFPVNFKEKSLIRSIVKPPFTPYLGPLIIYPKEQNYYNRLSYEQKLTTELRTELPDFHKFNVSFSPAVTNWLPWYWAGYRQTTRYTYRLEPQKEEEALQNVKESIRRQIKKASKSLYISESDDPELFYRLNSKTFARQGKEMPYSKEDFLNLDAACLKENVRRILLAKDAQGNYHAGIYLVWDKTTVYYLMGGSDSKFRSSGAGSLIMWEAIRFAFDNGKVFDFEGSMIEPIERFFRSFGARQVPYFEIRKYNKLAGIFLNILHELKKGK